jgi:hypothetical protein
MNPSEVATGDIVVWREHIVRVEQIAVANIGTEKARVEALVKLLDEVGVTEVAQWAAVDELRPHVGQPSVEAKPVEAEPVDLVGTRDLATELRRDHDPDNQPQHTYARCQLCDFTRHPCEVFTLAGLTLGLLELGLLELWALDYDPRT